MMCHAEFNTRDEKVFLFLCYEWEAKASAANCKHGSNSPANKILRKGCVYCTGSVSGGNGALNSTRPSSQNGQVILPVPEQRKHFPLPRQAGQVSSLNVLPEPVQLVHLPVLSGQIMQKSRCELPLQIVQATDFSGDAAAAFRSASKVGPYFASSCLHPSYFPKASALRA